MKQADSYVLSFLITGLHHFLVDLVVPAGPSPTTTWHTITQLAILTTSTLTPCAGRPYAPYILLKLQGSSLHRVTEGGAVIPPAMWLSMSTSPGRSCCAQLHESHGITSWRSLQRSWSCTHATSNATHPAQLITNCILTGPTLHSSIWVKRKRRRREREKAGEGCPWGRHIGLVRSLTSTSQHTSTLVSVWRATCPWLKMAALPEEDMEHQKRMKRRTVKEKWIGKIWNHIPGSRPKQTLLLCEPGVISLLQVDTISHPPGSDTWSLMWRPRRDQNWRPLWLSLTQPPWPRAVTSRTAALTNTFRSSTTRSATSSLMPGRESCPKRSPKPALI